MAVEVREPRFSVTCLIEAEGLKSETFIYEGETPRELMDAYQQLVGDGNAGVSVSTDMGVKKFGSGAQAMVTISLTCNQDLQTLQQAAELAAQMGRYYAKQYQQQAEGELRALLQASNRAVEF